MKSMIDIQDDHDGYRYKENGFVLIREFNNPHIFEGRIDKYLKMGFKLHGEPFYKTCSRPSDIFYTQALYKEV